MNIVFWNIFLDKIRSTAVSSDEDSEPTCPFCRQVIELTAEEYPVSSLSHDQQREIDQLQIAIKSQSAVKLLLF